MRPPESPAWDQRATNQIAWIGATHDHYALIRGRIRELGLELVDFTSWKETHTQFADPCSTPVAIDRMILACENRLDLPSQIAGGLPFAAEFPFAVVGSDWWQGASMSGNRSMPFLAFSWYRWWDALYPWLTGQDVSLLQQAPLRFCRPSVATTESNSSLPQVNTLHIVAGCRDVADSWQIVAERFAAEVEVEIAHVDPATRRLPEIAMQEQTNQHATSVLLVDDSVFPTTASRSKKQDHLRWFEQNTSWLLEASRRHLQCIFTSSIPRWDAIATLQQVDWDWIVKPTVGEALANALGFYLAKTNLAPLNHSYAN